MFRICLIWILFVVDMRSTPPPSRTGSDLTYCHLYMSISNPTRQVAIYSAHPIGPYFLRSVYYFEFMSVPFTTPLTLSVEHHYIRIDGQCTSNIAFSTMNGPVIYIKIKIEIYTGIGNDLPLALFHYRFEKKFLPATMTFYDTRMNFGIEIHIETDGDQHIPTPADNPDDVISHLGTLEESDFSFCALTQKNDIVRLKPECRGRKVVGTITHITMEYELHDGTKVIAKYPVFKCQFSSEEEQNIILISEDNVLHNIVTKIHYTQYTTETVQRSESCTYMRGIFTYSNYKNKNYEYPPLYVLNTQPEYITCLDHTERAVFKFISGEKYWAMQLKSFKVTDGVSRLAWVSKPPSDPCS